MLVVLALAANCAAAPGASVVSGVTSTSPSGFVQLVTPAGVTSEWVNDAAQGFCQIAVGATGTSQLQNCISPPTIGGKGVLPVIGQPSYDGALWVYLPDSSAASKGITRYSFNGDVFDPVSGITLPQIAGGLRPAAVAVSISSDSTLYVSVAGGGIYRVSNPTNDPSLPISKAVLLTSTLSKAAAHSLAFVGAAGCAATGTCQLWIADGASVSVIANPFTCGPKTTPCTPIINTQPGIPGIVSPTSIAFDGVNSMVYIGVASGVYRNNLTTGVTDFYSAYYVKNGTTPGLYSDVTAVGVDNVGNIYVVDDPTLGKSVGGATVYQALPGLAPDGVAAQLQPSPLAPPTAVTTASTNPAWQYSTGLSTPKGALWLGTHMWVVDRAHGFCKVDPTLPAPSLTACAALLVTDIPGLPAFDAAHNLLYIPDTAVTPGDGIQVLPFDPVLETLGAASPVAALGLLATAAGAGATAPTALAFGPDGQLYVAMGGTSKILRVTAPFTATHTITAIGAMNHVGAGNIAFYHGDLYDAETLNVSIMRNATLCKSTCTAQSLIAPLTSPTAVASDGNFVYIGDARKVWKYDLGANTITNMADVGLTTAFVPTSFAGIGGLAIDPLGQVYAADQGPAWQVSAIKPTIVTLSPSQAPATTTVTVTITGTNFSPGMTVAACPAIVASGVTFISATQITASFNVNVGPVGPCGIEVVTAVGTSFAANFEVLTSPPSLATMVPTAALRGASASTSVSVTLTGTNMTGATLSAGPDIVASMTTASATQIVANFAIPATAAAGPVNVTVTTPSGASNGLAFTINVPIPVLTSISPVQGSGASSVPVTLVGTGLFGGTLNLPTGITLTGTPLVTPTSINATLAIAASVPNGPQSITVTNAAGISNALTFNILPVLTNIAPATAKAGTDTAVTLTGTSLDTVTSINAGANVTVTAVVPGVNQITATFTTLNSAPLGAQSTTVTNAGGTTNAMTFTITAPTPILSTILPVTGGRGASLPVTLTGSGLVGATLNLPAGIVLSGPLTVAFGQITAPFVIADDAPLGAQNITATTPGGTSIAVTFTVFAPVPTLTSITPAQGSAASSVAVTLVGTGLVGATLNLPTGITLSGTPVVNALSITASLVIASTVPAGPQSITVTTPGGTTSAVTFNILPVLTSIAAAQAKAGTATAVTLTGTSLDTVTSINAGANITVTGVVATVNQVTATLTTLNSSPLGAQSITLTNTGGTSNALSFTITEPTPVLAGIAPVTGARGASVPVTLTGSGLVGATLNLPAGITLSGAPVVAFGQITASFAIADNAPLGVQSITATTPGGISIAVTFTVFAPVPVLTSITPAQGSAASSVPVTLVGTGLVDATLTMPAGITLSGAPVVTVNSISANLVISPGATGTAATTTASISVTTPGGPSNVLSFAIVPRPLLSIANTHIGNFTQAQTGAAYTVTVSNATTSSPTSGPVTVTETVASGLTLVSMTGNGWACSGSTCTRADALAGGASYPAITVTVNVPPTALSPQVNAVSVSGGNSFTASTTDSTVISFLPPTLTAFTPALGVIGTSVPVTFTGTNLTLPTLNLPTGITATGVVIGTTQIIATLNIALSPALAGPQIITIGTPGGISNPVTFTVLPLVPVLTTITPATGATGSSVTVTLTGTSLANPTLILSSDLTASSVVATDNQITAILAISATAALGPQSISITTAGGTSNAVSFAVIPGGLVAGYWLAGLPAGSTAVPNVVSGGPALTLFNNPTIGAAGIGLNAALRQYGTIAGVTLPETITVITVGDTTNNSTWVEQGTNAGAIDGFFFNGAGLTSFDMRRGLLAAAMPNTANWEGVGPVMLGATFDGAAMSIYRNGAAFRSAAVTHVSGIATNTVYVGARAGAGLFMNGNLRFVGIWNRALSAIEIANVYQSLKTEFAGLGVTLPAAPPTLAAIAPLTGVIGASVPVTLTGVNLTGATLNMGAGITATGVVVTDTQITATLAIPATAPLGPQSITVTTAGGTSNPVALTILPLTPTLATVAPLTGVIGTSVPVTLTGTNLAGATLIPGAGITATGVVATDAQITATLNIAATAAQGPRSITVTTAGGTSNAVTLTINPLTPTLTAIAPLSGVIGTSVTVTLTGKNLAGATLIPGAGVTATLGAVTATQITATLAIAGTAPVGPQSITVTTAGGTSNALTITILPLTPTLTTIAPLTGVIGTSVAVTLTGTSLTGATLNPGAGITATVGVVTDTQIAATLNIAATAALGARSITVTTAGGTSNAVTLTILPPTPTLTAIAPLAVAAGTSAAMTFTGTNLTGATLNLPAGITTTGAVVTATQITATLNVAFTAALGPQSITVTTVGGTSNAATFTNVLLVPALATIASATGAVGTSVAVTLTGTDLTGATFNLGADITATSVVASANQITATFGISATAALGPQGITVTTPGGTSNAVSFAVIPNGMVAGYWLAGLPAGSTAVPNIVSGGPALTLFNKPTLGAAGIGLNALLHQYGTIAGVTLPETMTVITVGDTTNNSTWVEQGTNAGVNDGFFLNGAGLTSFDMRRGLLASAMPNTANWEGVGPVMLGATFDGAAMNIYRNGAPFRSAAVPHVSGIVTDTVYVGARAGAGLFMNGNLRFVGIWNRTLSAAEIANVYQSLRTEFAGLGVTLPAAPPTLAALAPLTGVTGASVPVTLTGLNLTGATLNPGAGVTATIGVITDTQITATLAVAATAPLGPQSITVTTAGGTSNAVTFTIKPLTPALTTIAPLTGVIGTSVAVTLTGSTLAGATLNPGPGITATGVVATDAQITATLNIAATAALGPRSITVTTAGGTSNAMTYTINPPTPTLTTIAPLTGVTGTSVAVTLTGTNLAGATLIPGAGITATGLVASATQITATLNIAATAAQGPRSITVTTAGGTSNAVTLTINPPTPTLTTIAPLAGVLGTSVAVTLTGTNLTGATLNPGTGITATVGAVTATQITATLAIAGTAPVGPQSITVTTAGGTSNALTITINPPLPTLAIVAPSTGAIGTSVAVTLTGAHLTGATLNLSAGITAASVVVTDTQMTATLAIAATAALAQSITVTTPNGISNTLMFAAIPDGLVAGYWLAGLPAGSTAVPNLASGGAALTLFNKPTIGAAGIGLNALLHQYGTIAGVTLPETMTVITVGDTTNNSTFVEQSTSAGTHDGFYFYGLGQTSFDMRRGLLATAMPTNLNWEGIGPVMLGATFDGATMNIYRNGTAFRSAAVPHVSGIVTDTVYVGARAGAGLFMNGNLRFVGIWNRTLSAAEIAAVYQSLKTGFAGLGVTLP
jgi:uncharacterized protein YjbI with pentapeptide repeats